MNTLESAEILIIWGETFPGVARLEAWQNTQDAYAPTESPCCGGLFFEGIFWRLKVLWINGIVQT